MFMSGASGTLGYARLQNIPQAEHGNLLQNGTTQSSTKMAQSIFTLLSPSSTFSPGPSE